MNIVNYPRLTNKKAINCNLALVSEQITSIKEFETHNLMENREDEPNVLFVIRNRKLFCLFPDYIVIHGSSFWYYDEITKNGIKRELYKYCKHFFTNPEFKEESHCLNSLHDKIDKLERLSLDNDIEKRLRDIEVSLIKDKIWELEEIEKIKKEKELDAKNNIVTKDFLSKIQNYVRCNIELIEKTVKDGYTVFKHNVKFDYDVEFEDVGFTAYKYNNGKVYLNQTRKESLDIEMDIILHIFGKTMMKESYNRDYKESNGEWVEYGDGYNDYE